MNDNIFVKELCEKILEYRNIPKIQVERMVGPILSMFIEDILAEAFKNDKELSGKLEILSPEWPLKKGKNNQSTNIDWLLINRKRNMLFFVELKTAVSSHNSEQLELYLRKKEKISNDNAEFLYTDIVKIAGATKERDKYDYLLKNINDKNFAFKKCKDSAIIYLVPEPLKRNLEGKSIDHILSFKDLPERIPGIFGESWELIHKALCELERDQKSIFQRSSGDQRGYYRQIISNISRSNPKNIPNHIRFGNIGTGNRPNYQIRFSDGTDQPFYSSGKPYTSKNQFKDCNLAPPIDWKDFVEKAESEPI